MDESEARGLRAGDRVVYRIGEGATVPHCKDCEAILDALFGGRVARVFWAAFEVRWDDGLLQVISFNEAHNIFQEGHNGRIREPWVRA
jgi:hypothetical protein